MGWPGISLYFRRVLAFSAVLGSLSDLLGLRRSGVTPLSLVYSCGTLTFRTCERFSAGLRESPGTNLRRNPGEHRCT